MVEETQQKMRLYELVQSFEAYDIISVQENCAFLGTESRDIFNAYAMKAGFIYQIHDPKPPYEATFIGASGESILSRFPIVASAWRQFSYSQELHGLMYRGVVYAKIQIQN